MKIKREGEELIHVGIRLPVQIKAMVNEVAYRERRSINDQYIVLLEKALNITPPEESSRQLDEMP